MVPGNAPEVSDLPQTLANEVLGFFSNKIFLNGGGKSGTNSESQISGWVAPLLNALEGNKPYDNQRPKAYLNWIIVDEEFKEVLSSNHEGAIQVPLIQDGQQKQQMVGLNNLTVRRNGWLYVYVSNESNMNVYFDDLIVNHKRGPVVAAQDYYPFGLEIAGLSTKSIGFGGSENRYEYNGKEKQDKEFSDGSGLEWYDYGARSYNPQLGIWHVIDPHNESYESWTPYNYVGNNPILLIDPNGMNWYRHDASGAVLWLESENLTAEIDGQSFKNIGKNYTEYLLKDNILSIFSYEGKNLASVQTFDVNKTADDYNALSEKKSSNDLNNFGLKFSTSYIMTHMWANSYGPRSFTFFNSKISYAFQNSRISEEAREYFYNKVKKGKTSIDNGEVTNFAGITRFGGGNFGFTGLAHAGLDPVEQFVGSTEDYTLLSNGEKLVHIITNTTSFKSLMYGVTPEWLNFRNTRQTYIFTEPINYLYRKK